MNQERSSPGNDSCILAVDVGGTKIAGAFVSSSGTTLQRWEEATETGTADGCTSQLRRLIRHATATLAPAEHLSVTGIGIGVPGAVRRDGTVWAPNIPGWTELPLAEMIREEWKLPVAVDCDRATFALAEHWLGAGRDTDNLAVVILGTGVGVGLIVDGHVWRGFDGLAGCIGWTPIASSRLEREEYRRWGALEALVAGPGLARRAKRAFAAIDRSTLLPESASDPMSAEMIAHAARRGDATAARIYKETGAWLGLALAGLVSLVNPELLLLGGGMAAASDLMLPEIEAAIKEYGQPIAAQQVTLGVATLGPDAGILGAAALLLKQ